MAADQQNMYDHFIKIATSYKDLRTTDLEPILFINKKLKGLNIIKATDIGCGAGRYDLLFFKYLNNLSLTCIDNNESMLEQTSNHLKNNGITNFKTIKSDINDSSLEDGSMDCIFTFNAIHHFDFVRFIENAARTIKKTGFIFIYTRLRSQNAKNIWGVYFPLFLEKEDRLYELGEMETMINSTNSLTIESIKNFKYKRSSTLKQLINKVKAKHYSTFSLYKKNELKDSLKKFRENIIKNFSDPEQIEWFDENILLVLRHKNL
jgi:ubiquinone/menaquinone biosynthesis C-methylase UbiE